MKTIKLLPYPVINFFKNIFKQLESKGLILNSNTWMNGTVIIDSTVGKDTFFLITWTVQEPIISLWDPNGIPMRNFTVDTVSKMAYLRIPGTAKVSS